MFVKSKYTSFNNAIKFDFEKNEIYHDYMNVSKSLRGIPNIHVYIKKFSFLNNKSEYIIDLLKLIYLILFPFFLVYKFFSFLFYINFKYNGVDLDNVYLGLSEDKYFASIDSKKCENFPETYVVFNQKRKASLKDNQINIINFKDLITFKDLVKTLISSFYCQFKLSDKQFYIFFTYCSFDWFLTYTVLKRLKPNQIWISNHYDRWTVLSNDIAKTILVQHGVLYFKDYQNKVLFPSFSIKLNNIFKIFHSDDSSLKYFKRYINNSILIFEKIIIKTTVIDWSEKNRILIIGNKMLEKDHVKLIDRCSKEFNDLKFAYKYHPLQQKKINTLYDIKHIFNKNEIIDSDFIISYGSSIDLEIKRKLNSRIITITDFKDISPKSFRIMLNV